MQVIDILKLIYVKVCETHFFYVYESVGINFF